MNKTALPIAIIVTALIALTGGYVLGQGKIGGASIKSSTTSPASNLLLLTNPVNSFSGKVDKVEQGAVVVSQQFTLAQNIAPATTTKDGKPPVVATPVTKTLTFIVKVTQNTQINQPIASIPYLIKTVQPSPPPKGTLKDIKVGQQVSIFTNTDLRMLKTNEFEASSIQLPPIANSISGKLASIKGNVLTVKAIPPQPPLQPGSTPTAPKEVNYTVTVTDNTEISRYGQAEPPKEGTAPKPPAPEKLDLSDLKEDMQVTVYTNVDTVANQKITALRIEPFIVITLPPVAPISPPAGAGLPEGAGKAFPPTANATTNTTINTTAPRTTKTPAVTVPPVNP